MAVVSAEPGAPTLTPTARQPQGRNFFYIVVSEVFRKGVLYLCFVLAARALGPEDFGRFSVAMAIGSIVAMLTDLGFADWTTRELSRDNTNVGRHFGGVVGLKLLLFPLTVAAAAAFAWYLAGAWEIMLFIAAATYYSLVGFTQIAVAVFRAREQMQFEAKVRVGEHLLLLVLLLAVGRSMSHPLAAASLFVTAGVAGAALALYGYKRWYPLRLETNLQFWGRALKSSAPFAVTALFVLIYFKVNVILLARLDSETAAGLFTAGNQIILGLLIIPSAIAGATFPALARQASKPAEFRRLLSKAVAASLLIAVPIALVLHFSAGWLLPTIYGQSYVEAVHVFRPLVLVVPAIFLTVLLGPALQAFDRAHAVSFVAAANLAVNLTLNILLIPRMGAEGAAWAAVATECFGLTAMTALILYATRSRRGKTS